jgi:hypothetical protein
MKKNAFDMIHLLRQHLKAIKNKNFEGNFQIIYLSK